MFSFIEVQGPQQEVQGPPINRKYVQGPQNMWPLHTSEVLAPPCGPCKYSSSPCSLHPFVVLAHGPCTSSGGPCTGPCPRKTSPFGRLSGIEFSNFGRWKPYCKSWFFYRFDVCESRVEVTTPFWATNSKGKVRAIVNDKTFEQAIHQEICL